MRFNGSFFYKAIVIVIFCIIIIHTLLDEYVFVLYVFLFVGVWLISLLKPKIVLANTRIGAFVRIFLAIIVLFAAQIISSIYNDKQSAQPVISETSPSPVDQTQQSAQPVISEASPSPVDQTQQSAPPVISEASPSPVDQPKQNETKRTDDVYVRLKKMEADSYLYIYGNTQAYRDNHFRGICPDSINPQNFLKRTAEQGEAIAQSLFAGCYEFVGFYENGAQTPINETKAFVWYRKAAEQGYVPAQHRLGLAYLNGAGIPKNEAQAVIFFRKAAEQGYAPAQEYLGAAYLNGTGIVKDATQADIWYQKAAEQGYEPAQTHLNELAAQQAQYEEKKKMEEYQKEEESKEELKKEKELKRTNKLKTLLKGQDEIFSKFPSWRKIYVVNMFSDKTGGIESEVSQDDLRVVSSMFDIEKENAKACLADSEQAYVINSGNNVKLSIDYDSYQCKIISGEWLDGYTGDVLTDIHDVTFDRLVSFDDAWESGANQWEKDKIIKFTNNERYLYHDSNEFHFDNFIIVSKKAASSRGGKTIENWLPDDEYSACNFINSYAATKIKYGLSFLDDEVDVIKKWKDNDVRSKDGHKTKCNLYAAYDKGLLSDSMSKRVNIRD